jgi:hypothetical protein
MLPEGVLSPMSVIDCFVNVFHVLVVVAVQVVVINSGGGVTDCDLHSACKHHLGLSVPALMSPTQGSKPFCQGKTTRAASCKLTLDQFVDYSKTQLELEEAEEVAQAELELMTYGIAGAQV